MQNNPIFRILSWVNPVLTVIGLALLIVYMVIDGGQNPSSTSLGSWVNYLTWGSAGLSGFAIMMDLLGKHANPEFQFYRNMSPTILLVTHYVIFQSGWV